MFAIPIFPLPNVVLFPNVFLPLHIFEPRYRQLVDEALEGDRIIGMVLLKPGYESDYEGRPQTYPTGCSGLITHEEKLEDGRYNLVLRGLEKFSIQSEEPAAVGRLYRSAVISPLHESVTPNGRLALRLERQRLQHLLETRFGGHLDPRLPDSMADEDLINTLAQYLEFEPLEKLALLECESPIVRCRTMIELLEMKALAPDNGPDAGMIH
jgi:Lon protease-like protein